MVCLAWRKPRVLDDERPRAGTGGKRRRLVHLWSSARSWCSDEAGATVSFMWHPVAG